MSIVTKTFNKQRRVYFTYLWRGIALMAIGIYCAIMILKNGMGTSVQTGGGANIPLRKLMGRLAERGINAEQLLPGCMIGLFCILAAIGLFNVVRGIWLMSPGHTMLGKSILLQRKGGEGFQEVVDSISADLEQEPYVFGSVRIGRKWILDTEAMRLADIRGVFWFDHAMEDYVICCVDENQNIWAASLRYSADRDKAAEQLKKMLPDAASGDKNAYIAFLGGEPDEEEPAPEPDASAPALSPDATFCFVGAEGIPTSNFTCETACGALHGLEVSQTIALKVLTPKGSAVSEIFFTRTDSGWTVGVLCRRNHEDCRLVNTVDESQAESILADFINQKRLPGFCCV